MNAEAQASLDRVVRQNRVVLPTTAEMEVDAACNLAKTTSVIAPIPAGQASSVTSVSCEMFIFLVVLKFGLLAHIICQVPFEKIIILSRLGMPNSLLWISIFVPLPSYHVSIFILKIVRLKFDTEINRMRALDQFAFLTIDPFFYRI